MRRREGAGEGWRLPGRGLEAAGEVRPCGGCGRTGGTQAREVAQQWPFWTEGGGGLGESKTTAHGRGRCAEVGLCVREV